MKNLILTFGIILSLSSTSFSQSIKKNNKMKEIMNDSLGNAVNRFCVKVQEYLCNEITTKKDVESFLNYVYAHADDTLQSSESIFPYDVPKDTMFNFLKKQTKNLIGSNCKFKFRFWDGWDGHTNFVGFGFDIIHDGQKEKFLMIVDGSDKIHCIFSMNSI